MKKDSKNNDNNYLKNCKQKSLFLFLLMWIKTCLVSEIFSNYKHEMTFPQDLWWTELKSFLNF